MFSQPTTMSIIKDCFDDPTVNVSVSPRELRLLNLALNAFNEQLKTGDYVISEPYHERWEVLHDHVQDLALEHGI